tara:strand:+ start:510 stop:1088 length:579 start_codon:yes stop_codon:yes gene_type:complete
MWLLNNKQIQVGRSFVDSKGVKHPRNWSNWTAERKQQVGLVWKADSVVESYDERFYYSANNAKPLNDTPQVDENNQPVLDRDGQQVITKGLKTEALSRVKSQASLLLQPTDWYVTRFAEMGYDAETGTVSEVAVIPEDVKAFRAAVREASNTIETAITAAANLQAFMNLYKAPVDAQGNPTGPAPINAWPQS